MVSTDDEEIKLVAESLGALVPFFRSKKASDDRATLMDVLVEVLGRYAEKGIHFNYCCCILATAPFVSSKRLIKGYNLIFENQGVEAIAPIVQYGYPIQRALKIEQGIVSMADPQNLDVRSNDLPPRYHDAGQFYWVKSSSCSLEDNIFAMPCKPILLNDMEVQDIDSEEDWNVAEIKMKLQTIYLKNICDHYDNFSS